MALARRVADKPACLLKWILVSCILSLVATGSGLVISVHAQSQHVPIVPTEPANLDQSYPAGSAKSALSPPGIPLTTGSDPSYDEQLGMTFTQSFTSMLYNVTAVEQTDPSSGTGPAYLLNGLSDKGYWYQVGLSWNWSPGYSPGTGFDLIYEVFNSSGKSVFPTNGGGGLLAFTGQVNQGDSVELNLYFSTIYGVVMLAQDRNTGAYASETYSAESSTSFVGLPLSTGNSNGFFTGLMTEWYHPNAYYGNEQSVTFSSSFALSSAWMWIDEYVPPCCSNLIFSSSTLLPAIFILNPTQLQQFSSNGATEYGDAYEFMTGALSQTSLALSYSVLGGGTGYSPPVFTYVSGGVTKSATLSTSPSNFSVDPGSSWSVNPTLVGSTSSERWATGQATSGTVTSSWTIAFVYYNQYLQSLSYSVSDSSSPTAPIFTANHFGSPASQLISESATGYWFDGGASWLIANPIAGATGERWQINATLQPVGGTISAPQITRFAYSHQFQVTLAVSPSGAGTTIPSGFGLWENSGPLSVTAIPSVGYTFVSWNSSISSIGFAGQTSVTTATITGSGSITASFRFGVTEQITLAPGSPTSESVSMSVSGCHSSVSTIPVDGRQHSFASDPSCTLTLTSPADTATQRFRFSPLATTWTYTTTSSGAETRANTLYIQDILACSYSVSGGGSPGTPTLSYTYLGTTGTDLTLSTKAGTCYLDDATGWTLTNPLSGSTSLERWDASSQSGTAVQGRAIAPVYYRQYLQTLSVTVNGGGSPVPPTFTGISYGAPVTPIISTAMGGQWLDAGTSWSITNPLTDSTTSERWQTNSNISGTANGSGVLVFTYYHQYAFTLNYGLIGGGNPTAPSLGGEQFGHSIEAKISSSAQQYFNDAGSTWNVPSLLPSSDAQERWETTQSTSGTLSIAEALQLNYQHQYTVATTASPPSGGQITNLTGWHNFGETLQVSAAENSGWKFMGWNGAGQGSYSGPINSTTITVGTPITESAVFYPGFKIIAGSDGSVFYSFGSTAETLTPGASTTIYAPYKSNISLTGSPSSILYAFTGWTGAGQGNSNSMTLALTSPGFVQANFSYNIVSITGIGAALVAVVASTIFILRKRGRTVKVKN